jgi:hypothetical protein
MAGLNYFGHHMQVATRLAIYRPFLTEKTLENAKFIENPSNLDWCLELVIQDHGKNIGGMDAYHGHSSCWQILGSFQECPKKLPCST